MKKYFGLIIAFAVSLSFSGCNNNTVIDNSTTPYENGTTIEDELTNPGEYLADLCSRVKIGDVEFSLPYSFEKFSELFSIKEGDNAVLKNEADGYDTHIYDMYCGSAYFGRVSFLEHYNGKVTLGTIKNDCDKGNMSFELNGLMSGKTTKLEIEGLFGKGYGANFDDNEDYIISYFFEDGNLFVSYLNDLAVEFIITFNTKFQ